MRRLTCLLYPVITLNSFITHHAAAAATHPECPLTSDSTSVAIVSNSQCIFENLAVEEALLRGVVLRSGQQMLFSYVNRPCVVVGRNQNHLREVAVSSVRRDRVAVARRSSGGGAVYHDTGNICLSFFTHRDAYNPAKTIQVLRLFLCSAFGIHPERLTSTCRHDLFLDGKKITGSAMRVQRDIAYHHCTLLVSSCRERISTYIRPEGQYISFTSASTVSVRSSVTTLKSAGVLPNAWSSSDSSSSNGDGDGDDAVRLTQESLLNFFVHYGSEIISHREPSEIDPSAFPLKVEAIEEDVGSQEKKIKKPKALQQHGEGVFLLDVMGTLQGENRIVDAAGRKPAAGSYTLREEVKRLCSDEWIFSMPKFTTCVAITANDLLAGDNGDVDPPCILPEAVVMHLLQGHTQINITTLVERRRITELTACWATEPSDEKGNASWCEGILRLLLEGSIVDDATINISAGNGLLSAALELECSDLVQGMPLPPILPSSGGSVAVVDSKGDSCSVLDEHSSLLLFLRKVLCVWRTKNLFMPLNIHVRNESSPGAE